MSPEYFGQAGFLTWAQTKVIHYIPNETVTEVLLTTIGGTENESVEVFISTSNDGSTWSDWEQLILGTPKTLATPGKYVRVLISGGVGTELLNKDYRGVDYPVEIDILAVT